MPLSAAIITFNEARNLPRCLASLEGVADEIVVLDSFSTDTTEQIARAAGARFEQHTFDGHIQQKNRAIGLCTHDFVLSLDADEALDDTLRAQLLVVKASPQSQAYSFNRLTNYCGKWVRHTGWYPDVKTRLFDRSIARWGGVNPHDKIELDPGLRPTHLKGDLLHYSYYTREDHLKQIEYFSGIAAQELYDRGRKGSWGLVLIKVVAQFFKSFFLKAGFLDGYTGWTISRLSAYATYRKYRKLMLLHAQG